MNLILLIGLLAILGLTTYFIVRRVSSVTRTPVWLLWLVAMMPAFIWTAWAVVNGGNKPRSPQLFLISFVVCFVLYWFLIQAGRVAPPAASSATNRNGHPTTEKPMEPTPEPSPVRPIDQEEEVSLQNCFSWTIYYLQNIEYRPQAVICRGQLRSRPEVAYQTIRSNVEERFGDRFLVVFQEGADGKPFFALVTNPRSRQVSKRPPEVLTRPLLALGLLLLTVMTTAFGWQLIIGKSVQLSQTAFNEGLPYALALMTILGGHELAHYLTARHYRIQATLPYFIPVIPFPVFPFGTFGAFIQLRSPIPNRKALFDVGISGPLCGFAIALPLLLWGLAHSDVVPLPNRAEAFNLQALNPKFSLLLSLLSKLMLGSALTPETGIQLHPVAVAGCFGLAVTAINLMPVGQLDGGHIVHAMLGQRPAAMIGQIARLLLLLLAFVQPYLMLWAIILFLISTTDEPALNDVTEIDSRRDLWGLAALGLLLLIILPLPGVLAHLLHI